SRRRLTRTRGTRSAMACRAAWTASAGGGGLSPATLRPVSRAAAAETGTAPERGGTQAAAREPAPPRPTPRQTAAGPPPAPRQRRAPVPARSSRRDDRAREIDRNDDADDGEGPPGRVDLGLVRSGEPRDRTPDDEHARGDQDRRLAQRGQVLGLAVPVLMASV